MPGRRLVEEEQRRIVDERAGQLEAPLHPARQPAGPTAADVPQVDELEDLAGAPPARAPQHPEQRATKSTFSRAVRSGYSVNDWGM